MGSIQDRQPHMLTCLSLLITLTATQTVIPTTVSVFPTTNVMTQLSGTNTSYLGQVCSTWGNYHFKTFDGAMFQLPSTCNHILTSHCGSGYKDFNIQMRRKIVNNVPTISKILMMLEGITVELSKDSILVNGKNVTTPYVVSGVSIKNIGSITVNYKPGVLLIWNQEDSLRIEMNQKFKNQTCGLCGDFNGVETYDEFFKNGVQQPLSLFAGQWKVDDPLETCTDDVPDTQESCGDQVFCEQFFKSLKFRDCTNRLDIESFTKACMADMCHCDNSNNSFCLCDTLSEFSRQCVQAGGTPLEWRTAMVCGKTCPFNMVYQDCGSPCADSCSNQHSTQLCDNHCTDGCFCPSGTVFDDINKSGCIPASECSCPHNGQIYGPGQTYSTKCQECVCVGGEWSCQQKDCPGSCTVRGGSHINTFDGTLYTFHGDCSYVLVKECNGSQFTVLGDLVKCGVSDTQTCMRSITLALGSSSTIKILSSGSVYANQILTQLPLFTADVSIFQPSSFYIFIQTSIGLQLEVQLSPDMQLYITVSPIHKGRTCGLCGNYNNILADDFKVMSGLVEATPVAFANTWKTMASCPDVSRSFTNPCSLGVENEKYAEFWCSKLTDPKGVFAPCHSVISPGPYKDNCMYDTCNCEKSEDCMCAAVSSYVHACAAAEVILNGWRNTTCTKYSTTCPTGTVYSYDMVSCGRTCRSLSQTDHSCIKGFPPVDGCGCSEGTYMNPAGQCVGASSCPCYDKENIILPGQTISQGGGTCTCKDGKLTCGGSLIVETGCTAPMVYFNCSNEPVGATGVECMKSCNTLDMACISTSCTSGCMCPTGLVSDGQGGCILQNSCPCVHNGEVYQPGQTLKVKCNTCTCKARKWECTNKECDQVCSIYGDGNYKTFDNVRFTFNGACEYTLLTNTCSGNLTSNSISIVTENVPCGTTGTTCSKNIKLFMGTNELLLTDTGYQVIQYNGGSFPEQISKMGIYMVIQVQPGLILMWDTKTSLFIKMGPAFQGQVCGLCGNYDGDGMNDFTTRNQEKVVDSLDFGNSWKSDASCPDAVPTKQPCAANPYRKAWSLKKCSIIQDTVFQACHSQVDPTPYYDTCVRDSCACDSGGDCECFCTAVAAYAKACNEAGVCVAWRTPQICPLFCDYYNYPSGCEWHYKPCGASCMKTCRNPTGNCSRLIPALEGCYPSCPPSEPYFNEDTMKCVALNQCGCYDYQGNHYDDGSRVPTLEKNCYTCYCTMTGVSCSYNLTACTCQYNGKTYPFESSIYNTTDGIGNCIDASCGANGEIIRSLYPCPTTTAAPTPTTTASASTTVYTTLRSTTVFVFSTHESSTSAGTVNTMGSMTTTAPPVTTLGKTTLTPTNITTEAITSASTLPPKEVTTGPTTKATTVVVETSSTEKPSTESPMTTGQVVSTAEPTTVTSTTSVPSTTTEEVTSTIAETTKKTETTTEAIVSTSTVAPKEATTGPSTTATTVVVETSSTEKPSTESPMTTRQVVSTAEPTTVTSTTSVPSTTTEGITTTIGETTTRAETTPEATVSTSTVPPKEVTTGPTTRITTEVVETKPPVKTTTTSPLTGGQIISTTKPSTVTTTSSVSPSTFTMSTSTTPQTSIAPITQTVPTITFTFPTTSTPQTTTEATVSTSTVPPKEVTTGPTTTATTMVVETSSTEQPSTESPTTTGQVVSTAEPTTVTSTTSAPSTTTEGITTTIGETTTKAETTTEATVLTSTVPPKEVTTGPTTKATTGVVETSSTEQPSTESPMTTGQVVSTTEPTTVTSTTSVPSTTTKGITTIVTETTTKAEITTEAITSASTVPPKVVTTVPTTTATTVVAETSSTEQPSTESPMTTGQVVSTTEPTTVTSTTSVPSTTTEGITTTIVETTTKAETTTEATVSTSTVPPKEVTTGPTTKATTVVVETSSTEQPSTESPTTTGQVVSTAEPTTLTTSTSLPSPSTVGQTTTVVETTTTVESQTTTTCFCIREGTKYLQGDMVYNVTDGAGWCYTAYCNASCQVEVTSRPCPSTAPPTSTTPLYSTTAPLSTTSSTNDCSNLTPPRTEGESWQVNNCTSAICRDGKVIEVPVTCPSVSTPICANGHTPVKVYDTTGCCYQYECRCECSVWGKGHYITFDGRSYNFQQDCSYYLVKEIISKYSLNIVVDNHYCGTSGSSFCPQSLIISYKSFQIILTQLSTGNTITNVVYVNSERVYPPYLTDDFVLTSTGIELTLQIPEILTQVVYKDSSFSISLPYSLFQSNTEGQCGTCDNSQDNDCRSPNGQMQTCNTTAPEWVKGDCPTPVTTPGPTTSSAATSLSTAPSSSTPSTTFVPTPACSSVVCDIMNSDVFAACHEPVGRSPFVQACRSDPCSSCSSMEAYASQCSKAGVCIDWRNATKGQCDYACPNGKVYMSCGPEVQPTCSSGSGTQLQSTNTSTSTKEGCFCPQSTILFNSYTDTCVPSCGCTGPDGQPKQFGDTWTSGCHQCTCDKDISGVKCQPILCPTSASIVCSEPGFKMVTKIIDCCQNSTCECDVTQCPPAMTNCPLGFQPIFSTNSSCCPTSYCVPKGVCVDNTTEYQPGTNVPSDACEDCTCGSTMDPITKLHNITCYPTPCQTTCYQGYEYIPSPDKCCGTCVQTSCVVKYSDNTTHIVQVNETWSPPDNKCVSYKCEVINGQYITKEIDVICPAFHPDQCVPGTETTDADGCCKTCTPRSVCEVQTSYSHLVVKDCNSTLPVELTSCMGACQTSSIYSAEANMVMHQCACCQEANTSQRQVQLTCADGSTVPYTYIHINTCSCHVTECQEGSTTAATAARRRRRR